MRILGIETSCDETAVAVVDVIGPAKRLRVRVLSNVVASQVKLHAQFGGVVPNLAKREHQRNLVPVLLMALEKAGLLDKVKVKEQKVKAQIKNQNILSPIRYTLSAIFEREPDLFARMVPRVTALPAPKVDAVAVTVGPGLAPALWVGVNFARALSYLWAKPLIAVNHLEGHIYTNLLPERIANSGRRTGKTRSIRYTLRAIRFPALALIVSGGHTELVLMRRYGDYRVLGETRDDAAGEAFDKVAKMLGLGFPGGPIISRLAARGNPKAFRFPRPMFSTANFDFSFSGLKTAVLYTLRGRGPLSEQTKRDVAASFERAAVDVLVAKTLSAAKQYRAKTVMIGGGVAANVELRARLTRELRRSLPGVPLLLPDSRLTGDNALMIALAGWFNRKQKVHWEYVRAEANLRLDTPH